MAEASVVVIQVLTISDNHTFGTRILGFEYRWTLGLLPCCWSKITNATPKHIVMLVPLPIFCDVQRYDY